MRVDLRCDRRARHTACAVAASRVEHRASRQLLSGSGHNGIGLHLSGSGDLCHCPRRCRRIGRHLDCRAGALRRTAKDIVSPTTAPSPTRPSVPKAKHNPLGAWSAVQATWPADITRKESRSKDPRIAADARPRRILKELNQEFLQGYRLRQQKSYDI